jgi:hypothetical protein
MLRRNKSVVRDDDDDNDNDDDDTKDAKTTSGEEAVDMISLLAEDFQTIIPTLVDQNRLYHRIIAPRPK